MRKKSALVCLTFISCMTIRGPFYQSVNSQNQDKYWKLSILKIGFVGNVENKWWGDKFFRVKVKVTNDSSKYRFLKMFQVEYTDYNFSFVLNRNEEIRNKYKNDPSQFIESDFYKAYPGLDLLLEVSDISSIPKDTYKGNFVFPSKNLNGKTYISALLIASHFGIPMQGPIDSSENSTGWLAPGESKELTMHYSVPNGFKLSKIIFPGIYESNLSEETN